VERIATSVTSPDFGDSDDILLGVVQAASSKGSDQADVIKLQKVWPTVKNEINKTEELVNFTLKNSPGWITLVQTC
jgi:hypothetical protein